MGTFLTEDDDVIVDESLLMNEPITKINIDQLLQNGPNYSHLYNYAPAPFQSVGHAPNEDEDLERVNKVELDGYKHYYA